MTEVIGHILVVVPQPGASLLLLTMYILMRIHLTYLEELLQLIQMLTVAQWIGLDLPIRQHLQVELYIVLISMDHLF